MAHIISINIGMILIVIFYCLILIDAKKASKKNQTTTTVQPTAADDESGEQKQIDSPKALWAAITQNSGIATKVSSCFVHTILLTSIILILRDFEM
uniref:Uncharacterized protein n=1 Tax=Meteorus pulchricornis TaxID=51522 RepID=H7CHK1_9HYME|nr:hypothetical protein [Meteorus pulchricornis]